jgi:Xaa-Pro dipeptidase
MTKAVPYPFPPFTTDEYSDRIAGARRLMEAARLDALLLTTEANFRYFTGYHSQSWVSPTRPLFLVLPLEAAPIAVVPSSFRIAMERMSWLSDVRCWSAPFPADDGVSLLAGALREAAGNGGTVGAEFGPETQLRMPINDFLRVREAIAPARLIDGSPIMRTLRMTKSAPEVARMRHIAGIVSAGFAALSGKLRIGMSERDACLALQVDIMRGGAEKIPYLVCASGREGYDTINTSPGERVIGGGDLLIIDTGSTVDGYFCDFDRNFTFGAPSLTAKSAHARVHDATEAGIAALKPGCLARDIWLAMAASLGRETVMDSSVGRMGHGLGLQLTEPPSVHPDDNTVLDVGMVITLEPGIAYAASDGSRRVMVHEENLVITERGAELLTTRAPAEMPVII